MPNKSQNFDSNDDSAAKILLELKQVEQAVLDFLEIPVYKILIHWAKDFDVKENPEKQHAVYMNQFARAMIGDDIQVRGAVYAYLIQKLATPAYQIIRKAIDEPRESINRVAALFILRAGLNTFFRLHQCKNKCYNIIRYHPSESRVDALPLGRDNRELLEACMDSHDRILDAIGIDDIRAFDSLLNKASQGKCSLISDPSIRRAAMGGASPRAYDFRPTAMGGAKRRK